MEKQKQQVMQKYEEIKQSIENIKKVREYVSLDFKLYGESVDDIETLQEYRYRFLKAHDFRNRYDLKFNSLNENVKKVGFSTDDIALWDSRILRLKEQAEKELGSLDAVLIQRYKKNSISPLIEKDSDSITILIGYMVKDIPPEIIEETLEKCKEEQVFLPNMRELTDEEDMEYCYFLYYVAPVKQKKQKAVEIEGFINKVFNNMLQYEHLRNDIYNEYNIELIDRENKNSGKKQCSFDNFNPRPWQEAAFNHWQERQNNYHGTFSVATGAGKTLFALYCLERELQKGNDILTIIIVPTKAIMQNWYQTLIEKFHVHKEAIGRRGGGYGKCLWNTKKFIIYISNTAQKELANYTLAFDELNKLKNRKVYQFYICDECHRYATDNNLKMFDGLYSIKINQEDGIDYYSMGLSATPQRSDGREKYFYYAIGDVIYKYNVLEALADDVVSPFEIKNVYCKLTKKENRILKRLDQNIFGLIRKIDTLIRTGSTKLLRNMEDIETETIICTAYKIATLNKKTIEMILSKMENCREEYKDNADAAFHEWLDKPENHDMKIVYTCNMLVSEINKRKQLLMNAYHRKKKCLKLVRKNIDKKVIVFSEYIESAEAIYNELVLQYGEKKIKRYYSLKQQEWRKQTETQREKENMEALESFKNGTANVIVTVKALDEGVDVPEADIGIIYQSTHGTRQAIQRLGRIIRKSRDADEEKISRLLYLYHPKYQKEFLKDYFENPYELYYKAFDDDWEDGVVDVTNKEDKLIRDKEAYQQAKNKFKAGLEKIKFIPVDRYDFSQYDI